MDILQLDTLIREMQNNKTVLSQFAPHRRSSRRQLKLKSVWSTKSFALNKSTKQIAIVCLASNAESLFIEENNNFLLLPSSAVIPSVNSNNALSSLFMLYWVSRVE